MTVSSTVSRVQYEASEGETVFAYTFRIISKTHLVVYVNDSLKTVDTDYTVSGVGDEGGGNVTFYVGLTAGDIVTIYRDPPLTQLVDYPEGDAFPSASHEGALDKLTWIAQRFYEQVLKIVQIPIYSEISNLELPIGANKGIRWNSAGDGLELFTVDEATTSVITTKGDLVVGDATGSPEREGIGSAGDVLSVIDGVPKWGAPVAVELTNKSGGTVYMGDVVVVNPASDSSFVTTTVQAEIGPILVVDETIANDDTGRCRIAGVKAVAVDGSVARGDFLITSTTAGKAMSGGPGWPTGAFGVALTADAGGYVTALLFGKTHVDVIPMTPPINLDIKEYETDGTASVYRIFCDYITLTDGLDVVQVKSVDVWLNLSAAGAGGLDTGSPAASTWYYIWSIYNPTTGDISAIFSTSASAPTMPSGYTFKRKIGCVYNLPYSAQLHMDGADQGTDFPDETGKTWTANGNARTVTGVKKWGTAAAYFDGSGDWIDTPDHDDFNLGRDDFTLEFWVRRAGSIGTLSLICGQSTAGSGSLSFGCAFAATNVFEFRYSTNGSSWNYVNSTTTITDTDTWHHARIVRHGNMIELWLDGNLETTAYVDPSANIFNSTAKMAIGRLGEYASNTFNGYIDEFVLLKGAARSGNDDIVLPASAYKNDVCIRKVVIRSDGWHHYDDPQWGPAAFIEQTLTNVFQSFSLSGVVPAGATELSLIVHDAPDYYGSQAWSYDGVVAVGSVAIYSLGGRTADTMARVPWNKGQTLYARNGWLAGSEDHQYLHVKGFRLEV